MGTADRDCRQANAAHSPSFVAPVLRVPDPSCAVSLSAASYASTTAGRPQHAGGSGPIVCPGRLGPLIRFYHWQAA
jgi:hypothetical protein